MASGCLVKTEEKSEIGTELKMLETYMSWD